jgi:hypothetical protein
LTSALTDIDLASSLGVTGQDYQIDFATTAITLSSDLPYISLGSGSSLTILGNGATLDGAGQYRGLLAYAGDITIDHLNLTDDAANGGEGGAGGSTDNSAGDAIYGGAGGGGAGLGGGLFVGSLASVTLNDVNFTGDSATGGNGGGYDYTGDDGLGGGGGGGGGMGGTGGNAGLSSAGNYNYGAAGGGGGGGGLGKTAAGGSGNYALSGGAGSGVGGASGGGGGSSSFTGHYIVYTDTTYYHGGYGGAAGGGGGRGFATGGGGGGLGGQQVQDYSLGSAGFDLSFSYASLIIGVLGVADVLSGGAAIGLTVLYAAYTYLAPKLGSPGYVKYYGSATITNDAGFGTKGYGIPGSGAALRTGPLGLGLNEVFQSGGGTQPGGGYGGFGGGGGGAGGYTQGGVGGFGGGGGGLGSAAVASGQYAFAAGNGGFGGGAGAGSYNVNNGNDWGGGIPGFGGGYSYGNYGGGGLGAGGAVFVQNGGGLTVSSAAAATGTVTGGRNGNYLYEQAQGVGVSNGYGIGAGMFLQGQATFTAAPGAGQTVSIGNIADEAGWTDPDTGTQPYAVKVDGVDPYAGAVQVTGTGLTELSGTNTYLGGTILGEDLENISAVGTVPTALTITPGEILDGTGGTLEIAASTSLYGAIEAPSAIVVGASVTTPVLILAAGATLANPIQIENYEGGPVGSGTVAVTTSAGGTLLAALDLTPLIVDETQGGTFTGNIVGLQPGQFIDFIGGGSLASLPIINDKDSLLDYVQGYVTYGGSLVVANEADVNFIGDSSLFAGTNAELQSQLAWLQADDSDYPGEIFDGFFNGAPSFSIPATLASSYPFTINLDGQIGSVFSLASLTVPHLLGPDSLVLANDGADADGSANAAHSIVTLVGGTIALNPQTALTLAGDGGALLVENVIAGSAGSFGLSTAGDVTLAGQNSFFGGIDFSGTLALTNAKAAGLGTISFMPTGFNFAEAAAGSIAPGQTLSLEASALPANVIANFADGDVIDIAGLTAATGRATVNGAGELALDGAVLTLAGGAGEVVQVTSLAGGAKIQSLDYSGTAVTVADLQDAETFVSLANPLVDDVTINLNGSTIPLTTLDDVIHVAAGENLTINGEGGSIPTGMLAGPTVASGDVTFTDITLGLSVSGAGFKAGPGAVIYDDGVVFPSSFAVAQLSTGTLVLESGSLPGGVQNGLLIAAPFAGQTVTVPDYLAAAGFAVGNPGAVQNGVSTAAGGVVLAGNFIDGTGLPVTLLTDSTLEFLAGTDLSGEAITFASPSGATLKIEGTVLPGNEIDLASGLLAIDLAGLPVATSSFVTLGSAGLSLAGMTGALNLTGNVTAGEIFVLVPDGGGGALLIPQTQSTTIHSGAQFTDVITQLNRLPGDDGLAVSISLDGEIALTANTPSFAVQPGVSFGFGGTGGLTVADGVTVALSGANSFTGGVTLGAGAALTLASPASGGTGSIVFDGPNAVLALGMAGDFGAVTGLTPVDTIDVAGTLATGGTVSVNGEGQLVLAGFTLDLPDLVPLSTLIGTADRHGGTDLTLRSGDIFLTAATEAELNADIAFANSTTLNTEIVLAPAGGTMALTTTLTAIAQRQGAAVFIEGDGAVLDGGGTVGGFYLEAGHVGLADLTIQHALEAGGTGGSATGPDGGGGGGGGAGLGGGLFVGAAANAGLYGVMFSNNAAIGGAGGNGGINLNQNGQYSTIPGGAGDATGGGVGLTGNGGAGHNAGNPSAGYGGFGYAGAAFTSGAYGGGGGLGAGGDIFVASGGGLTIEGSLTETGGTVAGGAAGTPSLTLFGGNDGHLPGYGEAGAAEGAGLYLASGIITLTPAGQTEAFYDAIGGGGGIVITGPGTVTLAGPLSYTGGTDIETGTLVLGSGLAGPVTDDGALVLAGTGARSLTGSVAGSGSLFVTGGTVMAAGGLSLGGVIDIAAGTLLAEDGLIAGSIVNDGTLSIGGAAPVAFNGPVSGSGDVFYAASGAATLSGADTGTLFVAAGALSLGGAEFSAITIGAGALTLGSEPAGPATISLAAGENGTLALAASLTPDYVIEGLAPVDVIDITGFDDAISVTASGTLIIVANPTATVTLTVSPDTTLANEILVLAPDGHGGTDLLHPSSDYQVSDEAGLAAAIGSIAPGGFAYASGIDYGISVASPITLTGTLPAFAMGAGSNVELTGDLIFVDPTGGRQGGGFNIASDADQLVISNGAVVLNAGMNPVSLNGIGVSVAAGAALEIVQSGGGAGAYSRTGVTVDGTLLVAGNFNFYALPPSVSPAYAHSALSGSGDVTLQNGSFDLGGVGAFLTDGNNSFTGDGISLAGTLAIVNGTLNVPGYAASGVYLKQLDLFGTSTAAIDITAVKTVVFEPGAAATLTTGALPNTATVIDGIAPGDALVLQPVNGIGPDAPASLTLTSFNELEMTAFGGLTYAFQFDPSQNLSGDAFLIHYGTDNATIEVAPAQFTVSTPAGLAAALAAISVGGSDYAPDVAYTITLDGDLTGANALTSTMPVVTLDTGSSLDIVGDSHTIDGAGYGIFDIDGAATLQGVTLLDTGTAATGGSLTLDGVTIAGGLSGSGVTLAAGTSLGGAINGTLFIAAPGAGESVVIGGTLESGSLLLDGPGALSLTSANGFAAQDEAVSPTNGGTAFYVPVRGGITLAQGTLVLGNAAASGGQANGLDYPAATGYITLAGNGEIIGDGLIPGAEIAGFGLDAGTIDLAGIAPGAVTITAGTFFYTFANAPNAPVSDHYDAITASGYAGTLYLDSFAGPLELAADGAGGSLLYVPQTYAAVTDGAGLAAALTAFDAGGAQASPSLADTIALTAGAIALTSAPLVAQDAGAALTVLGNGAVIDGGGGAGLTISTGPVRLETLTLTGFNPAGPVLDVGPGVSADLDAVSIASGFVELQGGAALTLDGGAGLALGAAIYDTGGAGALVTTGTVTLTAISGFSGGTDVDGVLELAAQDAAGIGAINFGAGSTLVIAPGIAVQNVISGLGNGGRLDLRGVSITSAAFAGDVLTLDGPDGTLAVTLADAGLITSDFTDELTLAADGAGGTLLGYAPRQTATVSLATDTVSLGNVHPVLLGTASSFADGTITLTNAGAAGGETLAGGFGTVGAGLDGTGLVTLAPGGTGTLGLMLLSDPLGSHDGSFVSFATLALDSETALSPAAPVAAPAVTVSGTVYDYAAPSFATTLSLGTARFTGATLLNGTLTIADGSVADPFQESLIYGVSAADPALTIANASGTIASGQSGAAAISLAVSTPGYLDDEGTLSAISTGAGSSGLGTTALGEGHFAITGTLFAAATAAVETTISLGILHPNQFAPVLVTIANQATASALTDVLEASVASVLQILGNTNQSVDYLAQGSTLALASALGTEILGGTYGVLTVDLLPLAGAGGAFAFGADVALTSHDPALPDLTLGGTEVVISGQVNNYATAALSLQQGAPGTLTGNKVDGYTLGVGVILNPTTIGLAVQNIAAGYADYLTGRFAASGGTNFDNTGLGSFIASSAGAGDFVINALQAGSIGEVITLTPTDSNAGGYSAALAPIFVTVTGAVEITDFTAASQADLDSILSEISAGGDDAFASTAYTITLDPPGGTLGLTAALPGLDLLAGSALSIAGGGAVLDGDGSDAGFAIAAGTLDLGGVTMSGFGPGGDVSAAAGSSVTIISGDFNATSVALAGTAFTFAPAAGTMVSVAGTIDGAALLAGAGTLALAGQVTGGVSLNPGSILRLPGTGPFDSVIDWAEGAAVELPGFTYLNALSLNGSLLTVSNASAFETLTLAQPDLSYYAFTIDDTPDGVVLVQGHAPDVQAGPEIFNKYVSFGYVPAGVQDTASLRVYNPLAQGGDSLVIGTGALGPDYTLASAVTIAPGQYGTLMVEFTPAVGSFSIPATLSLASVNIDGVATELPGIGITLTGAAFVAAEPQLSTTVIDFGTGRIGQVVSGLYVTLANGAAGSAGEQVLAYTVGTLAGVSVGEYEGYLAAGDTASFGVGITLGAGLSATAEYAGTESLVLPLTLASAGSGATTPLAPQNVTLIGAFYAPAMATYAQTLNLGWAHAGVADSGVLTVQNSTPAQEDSRADRLSASWAGFEGGFTGGSVSALAPGQAENLAVTLIASAGVGGYLGIGTLSLVSADPVLPNLTTLGQVALRATVTNFATLALHEVAGGGLFSGSGTGDFGFDGGEGVSLGGYSLYVGDITAAQTIELYISNAATGVADQLAASIAGYGAGLRISGAGTAATGLSAGQQGEDIFITLTPQGPGAFSDAVTIAGTGSNAGGFAGVLPNTILDITGTATVPGELAFAPVENSNQLDADLSEVANGYTGTLAAGSTITYFIPFDPAAGTITIQGGLTPIGLRNGDTVIINGEGDTVDGLGSLAGFFQEISGAVVLENLTIADTGTVQTNFEAAGGLSDGFAGGGTGFTGDITLANVTFLNNTGGPYYADDATVQDGSTLTVQSGAFEDTGAGGAVSLAAGSTLVLDPGAGQSVVISGGLTGQGAFTLDGAGQVTLGDSIAPQGFSGLYQGEFNVLAGTLVLAYDPAIATPYIDDDATLVFDTPRLGAAVSDITTLNPAATIFSSQDKMVIGKAGSTLYTFSLNALGIYTEDQFITLINQNYANVIPGLTAGLDGAGALTVTSDATSFVMEDGAGSPLEALGLAPSGLYGAATFAGYISGTGNVVAEGGGSLQITGGIGSSGTLELDGATMGLTSGALNAAAGIAFAPNAASTLALAAGLALPNLLQGFALGDAIDLGGFDAGSTQFSLGVGNVLDISDGNGETIALSFDNATALDLAHLVTSDDGHGGAILEVTCFLRGTRIATAQGELFVEELRIGDLVQTLHAGMQPVKWIGRRAYAAPFCNHPKVLPIRIQADAIATGVPARDLLVSPGHAIAIDGALIHAGRLVNGRTITQERQAELVEYFHIELAQHEVIFAEACPAETFLGEYFRPQFQNSGEFAALYPGHTAPEYGCLPALAHGWRLQAILDRLARRAGLPAASPSRGALRGYIDSTGPDCITGWALDIEAPDRLVVLDVIADGRRLGRVIANVYRADVQAAFGGSGYCGFELPLPPGAVPGGVEVRRAGDGYRVGSPILLDDVA